MGACGDAKEKRDKEGRNPDLVSSNHLGRLELQDRTEDRSTERALTSGSEVKMA